MINYRSPMPMLDQIMPLDRELDRVLNSVLETGRRSGLREPAQYWMPATDVIETADRYIIRIDLPGVAAEQLDLNFEQDTLTIRGTRAAAENKNSGTNEELRLHSLERWSGSFQRAFRLPEHVDPEKIEASFERGVLSVTVPKAPVALPRKIAVRISDMPAKREN